MSSVVTNDSIPQAVQSEIRLAMTYISETGNTEINGLVPAVFTQQFNEDKWSIGWFWVKEGTKAGTIIKDDGSQYPDQEIKWVYNTSSTESLFNKEVEAMKLTITHTDGSVSELEGDPLCMEYDVSFKTEEVDIHALQDIDWDSDNPRLPIQEQYIEVTVKYRFDKVELSHNEKGDLAND